MTCFSDVCCGGETGRSRTDDGDLLGVGGRLDIRSSAEVLIGPVCDISFESSDGDGCSALSKYAVVKTLQNLLWDVRATNASGKWELEPVPKAARLAIESMGLEIPTVVE